MITLERLHERQLEQGWAEDCFHSSPACGQCGGGSMYHDPYVTDENEDGCEHSARICNACQDEDARRKADEAFPLEHAPLTSIFEYRLEKSVELAKKRKAR